VVEDEVHLPAGIDGDVAGRIDPYLVPGQRLAAVVVDGIVARAVLEAHHESRAGPGCATVGGLDDQVLVVVDLSGLPEGRVLAVLEGDVDRAVRCDGRIRELILVADAGRPVLLEDADRGIRSRDLLRLRPGVAAAVAVRLPDRRGRVLAVVRDERAPGHVGAAVELRA